VCVAAVRSGRLSYLTTPIVAIVSGSNIDEARFEAVLATGMK